MLASWDFPKSHRIWAWHYFSTSLDQWEVPKMLASWGLPKIPSDLDMALFFNFPGSMGSSRNFRELPWELPKMLASWELPKIPSDFDMALFFQLPWINGKFLEVPGTSLGPSLIQFGNSRFLGFLRAEKRRGCEDVIEM